MFSATLALSALVVFWLMVVLFLLALKRRDAGMADVGWGLAILLAVLAVFLWHQPAGMRAMLVLILVAVWGMRLTAHVILRNWSRPEDWRHARNRAAWGEWFPLKSFVNVFIARSALLTVIALPALWIVTFGGPKLTWLDYLGLAIWVVGYMFETVADNQLVRFMKVPSNHGRVLTTGLWRLSRHPNYFGELTMWWGLWVMALSVPGGWLTFVGPVLLTYWVLGRSIPLVESRMLDNAEYRAYARRTSELLPW